MHVPSTLKKTTNFDFVLQSMNASRIHFDKINGLACSTNRSLTLLAMDSFTYELVAERLGITLKDTEQNTAAIIIDSEVNNSCNCYHNGRE